MNIDNMEDEIVQLVLGFKQLPYLFVGTGISMRYSNAPSWNDLLKNIWMAINGSDENKYKKFVKSVAYELKIDNSSLSDEERKYHLNPQLATKIQQQFNDKFYKNDSFENKVFSKDEVKELLERDYDPFKFYIAKQTQNLHIISNKAEAKEIPYIKKSQNKIAGIITTNYDHILEELFEDFDVVIGQDNMLTSNTNNIFEIFKIHGGANNPNSIVITQDDYKYFKNKLKYLSAKLLTLFVEHPIVFIGYGIGDLNIRSILEEIAQCLDKTQLETVKNNLIFLKPAFGQKEKISSKEIDFGDKRIIMTEIILDDFSVLFQSLLKIKSSMPIKMIRKMQDMICNFIATTEATNNIMVGNINNPNIGDDQVGIYFGPLQTVSSMGFDSYGIDEIIEDILYNNRPYLMDKQLIEKTFKRIRSIAGKTYLPIYKYTYGLNMSVDELPKKWHIMKSIDSDVLLNTTEKKWTKNHQKYCSIEEIEKDYEGNLPKQFAYLQYNIKNISVEDLEEYLNKKYKDSECRTKHYSTFKKLVAIYDYIKYNEK